MTIGLVGLGRMGANMARRLRRGGVEIVAWNRNAEVTQALARETGLTAAASLDDLVSRLSTPRVVWLMLPAGDVTQQHLDQLLPRLAPGDIVVDGANSWYKDSMRRGRELAARQLQFVDAGVSGGVWGLDNGYALMLGGEAQAIERLKPVIQVLAPAPDKGWLHAGPVGAGHFVKMIHNGIEYGMMQAYAEGFALMQARADFRLDLAAIAETWRHGSVVRSWLLDLTADFLARDQKLEGIAPFVADSGEGRWTALEGVELGVPTPVMSLALMMRFASQGRDEYADKLLAMMRRGFGGHETRPGKD
jgi:6-phosphogluconate dehydrogenase